MWVGDEPKTNTIVLKDCCVIIPVRNESDHLKHLFDSIDNQTMHPGMIVFVDDHSEDHSKDLIDEFIKDRSYITLIDLSTDYTGKKTAIRTAIETFDFAYYLTIDADTFFDTCFFKQLSTCSDSDMVIRPVIMQSKHLFSSFISAEYHFFNALNCILAPFYILSASGANLLFKARTFHETDSFLNHKHIASGDDHYLLRDFQRNTAKITIISNKESAIYTTAPSTLKTYFNQRIRWLGKTKRRTNLVELFIGLCISFYFIGIFVFSIWLFFTGNYKPLVIIFILRLIADTIVFASYLIRISKTKQLLWVPFFQIIYPLLFLSTFLLSLFYKPKWKGRS